MPILFCLAEPSVPGGPGQIGRPLRVYFVCLLLHGLPLLLVERGQVPRPGSSHAGLQVDHRLKGHQYSSQARTVDRPALSLQVPSISTMSSPSKSKSGGINQEVQCNNPNGIFDQTLNQTFSHLGAIPS